MRFDVKNSRDSNDRSVINHIAWFGGLQLLPQHFQAWDDRIDGLFSRYIQTVHPPIWGVDKFEIDDDLLSLGRICVISASGCFPDGLMFNWNSVVDGMLEISIDPRVEIARYALAVPKSDFVEGGKSVARFRHQLCEPILDREGGQEKVAITRLLPNLIVCPWDPLNQRYCQIPFFEVQKTSTGYECTNFYPPSTSVLRDSFCARELVSLTRLIRSKASLMRSSPALIALDDEYRGGVNWVLLSLVAGLPRLEAQLSSSAHPYEIFLSLCAVAGMVSPLVGRLPEHLLKYEHIDPSLCIFKAIDYIRDIVECIDVAPRRWREIPLIRSNRDWLGRLDQGINSENILIKVTCSPHSIDVDIDFWLEHALICFEMDVDKNRDARVRGLQRKIFNSLVGEGLDAVSGCRYLRVEVGMAAERRDKVLFLSGPDASKNIHIQAIDFLEINI